jgi:tetratricopeptide (TPR) repeat protein
MGCSSRRAACLAVVFTLLACRDARAAGADDAAAQVLFDEARRLSGEGRFAEACDKFAESQRLDPQPGTQLNLADCYEKIGRTASAWAGFVQVAELAAKLEQTQRQHEAERRAKLLKSKLSTLAVEVADPVEGTVVRRLSAVGNSEIGAAQWGMAIPVDPARYKCPRRSGAHHRAAAGGRNGRELRSRGR